jgi:hypothetical protein
MAKHLAASPQRPAQRGTQAAAPASCARAGANPTLDHVLATDDEQASAGCLFAGAGCCTYGGAAANGAVARFRKRAGRRYAPMMRVVASTAASRNWAVRLGDHGFVES